MNLTIHERHGGGFCVTLSAIGIYLTQHPRVKGDLDLEEDEAYVESDTLTLRFGSINAPEVTFESFSDLQRVLHGEVRLSLERLDP